MGFISLNVYNIFFFYLKAMLENFKLFEKGYDLFLLPR